MTAVVPASKSNAPKRMAAAEEVCSYLPDELLECIFKSHTGDNHTLKSLSVVSKQFLQITNRVRFSVTITNETIPYLSRLFHRFPNLSSLNLNLLFKTVVEVEALLTLISTFPLDIKSFSLATDLYSTRHIRIPANGLIALAKTMKKLTSLTITRMEHFHKNDLFFIADCFPLLEELNLTHPRIRFHKDFVVDDNDPLLALPYLRKINLSGNMVCNQFTDFLRQNCRLLQEITLGWNRTIVIL